MLGPKRRRLWAGTLSRQPQRLHACPRRAFVCLQRCSADKTFHNNRPKFQDALFDVLSPILGSPDVRQSAAKGIYGGRLPSWWKDLEAEKAEAAAAAKCTESIEKPVQEESSLKGTMSDAVASTEVGVPAAARLRTKCRYGAQCKRKNEVHLKEFSHPGDFDWEDQAGNEGNQLSGLPSTACEGEMNSSADAASALVTTRTGCRYGATCFRNGPEHRKAYAHPGDADWSETSDSKASSPSSNKEVADKQEK